jgi:Holliday junction resolvase RusA-like endonuclease
LHIAAFNLPTVTFVTRELFVTFSSPIASRKIDNLLLLGPIKRKITFQVSESISGLRKGKGFSSFMLHESTAVKVVVGGHPIPQSRQRFASKTRKHYNPNRLQKQLLQEQLKKLLKEKMLLKPPEFPIFAQGTSVAVSIKVYLSRPLADFKKKTRHPSNLKEEALNNSSPPSGPDVDNLAKFILDAMNGVTYYDDKQIVELNVSKHRDNQGLCKGRTIITVQPYVKTDSFDENAPEEINMDCPNNKHKDGPIAGQSI